MSKLLVINKNAVVDIEGIESKLKTVVDELNKVNSLAIHDEESNKKAKDLISASRKEFKVYDDERIEFKKEIMKPYDEVDKIFKKYNELHKKAIDKLSKDSKDFEENKRLEKEKEIITYFDLVNTNASFIKFEDLKLNIINSNSLISYKRQIDEFMEKINIDLQVINTYETSIRALILVEYEKHLDLGQAQLTVRKNIQRAEELKKQKVWKDPEKVVIDQVANKESIKEQIEEVEYYQVPKPNLVFPDDTGEIKKYRLQVELTEQQLNDLEVVLKQNNIKYSKRELLS